MKMPIAWHEENIKNKRAYFYRRQEELKRLQAEVDRLIKEIAFDENRVIEARSRGLTAFDPDRFMVKRS